MSFATTDEFLARVDAAYIGELVGTVAGGGPDIDRIQTALDDATAELSGYLPRIPAAHQPTAETLRVHAIKVAMYLLTLDRPAKEFEQIRNAYTDTISFYTSIITAAGTALPPLDASGSAPCKVFTDESLKGFVR